MSASKRTRWSGRSVTRRNFIGSAGVAVAAAGLAPRGIAAADVGHAEGLYFIAFAILFFFLLIVSLRLPLIYPLIVVVVVVVVGRGIVQSRPVVGAIRRR